MLIASAAGLFEKVEIGVHRARFIIGGESRPQRVERGGVIIRRSLAGGEIVIEKHAAVLIPEIFDNFFASLRGSVGPFARLVRMPEERADLLQIFFRFVEQAIEADGRKAVSVRAVRTETEAYIKAGLARAAIALVKIGGQLDAILVATGILILRCAGRAKLDIENRRKGRRLALLCCRPSPDEGFFRLRESGRIARRLDNNWWDRPPFRGPVRPRYQNNEIDQYLRPDAAVWSTDRNP